MAKLVHFPAKLQSADKMLSYLLRSKEQKGFKIVYRKEDAYLGDEWGTIMDDRIILHESASAETKLKIVLQMMYLEARGLTAKTAATHVKEDAVKKSYVQEISDFVFDILKELEFQELQEGNAHARVN